MPRFPNTPDRRLLLAALVGGVWCVTPDPLAAQPRRDGGGTVETGTAGAPTARRLRVRRFVTATLTDADVDRILADASASLQARDGAGDTACAVRFERDGGVDTFTDGNGSIDSAAAFAALMALPGHVKAVNQINWCGALIPGVIGCAPVPGNSLAIVRFEAALEGLLWAHEMGHNRGLNHRGDPNAVMNGTIEAAHRELDAGECLAFQVSPAVAAAAEGPPQPRVAGTASGPLPDIRDFVRRVFIHGVPFAEASRYGADAVPTLLSMLQDPREARFWGNIAVVLGMIGDAQVVDPLIAFLEARATTAARQPAGQYRARTSALMALGYLVNRTGDGRALAYLQAGTEPQAWESRAAPAGMAPFQASIAERNTDFARHAILGLALSGRPEAAETLQSLQQPATTESGRAFRAQVGDLVSEALTEHQRVSGQGLAEYDRANRR